jgi:hypothetical protein
MNPAVALGHRHPLNANRASFAIELFNALAYKFQAKLLMSGARVRTLIRASPSAAAIGKTQVGLRQLGNKEPRVSAALGGANFDNPLFHRPLLSNRRYRREAAKLP